MDKEFISQVSKDMFIAEFTPFLKECEPLFIEYFVQLSKSYCKNAVEDDLEDMALEIYRTLFKAECDILELKEKLLTKLLQDSAVLGFLINRSMFFVIEKYLEYIKQSDLESQYETLIGSIGYMVGLIEKETPKSCLATDSFSVDVGFGSGIVFSTSNKIIDVFNLIKDNNESVVFLNLYKGVLICSEARIVKIEDERVTFSVDDLQGMAMKIDDQAYILRNEHFGKHLKADIIEINFYNNTVVLSNFIYLLNMPILQREFPRVHPDIITEVYIQKDGTQLVSGRLFDISMRGIGIVSTENYGIYAGDRVKISFELNSISVLIEDSAKVEIEGEVIDIVNYQSSFRYCLRTFPSSEMSKRILNYITLREHEVIAELKDELQEYVK